MDHPTVKPAEHWRKILAPYRGAETMRSVIQLSVTAGAFFALWAVMFWSLEVSYALTLALAIPTAGFLVRLFMIQHDCGHGSYFPSARARNWTGFCIGVLTITPYHYWRKTHAYHHAHSGALDFRGFGDIETLTVREYLELPLLRRIFYRFYRNPFVLLSLGPVYHFLIKHRYPWDIPRSWKQAWASVWWTNICLVAIVVGMTWTIGLERFALIQIPVTLLASSLGVLLFYVQHQYESTYWHRRENWDFYDAALQGSSHLVLPKPLQWITASIGLHHVHHLNSMIPNYKLEACLRENAELQRATQIKITDTWPLLCLTLWDEETQQLIRFRDLSHAGSSAA